MGVRKIRGGLEFRCFHSFNLALLSKQCWKFLQEPTSYISQVFKQKYYPKSNLLEAKLGYKPSLVWRSLLADRQILEVGLLWRISNGRDVKIWKDPWLPNGPNRKISSPMFLLGEQATVSQLIYEDQFLFSPEEVDRIKTIPLCSSRLEDKLTWSCTKNGKHNVKSAYHLHQSIKGRSDSSSSQGPASPNCWKSIWSLKTSNSIRISINNWSHPVGLWFC